MFKKTESGRSIVEMLGVLAIMGVITVMGISGYSQAVARINRNKMVEDITRLAQEVRTLYAGRNNYDNLALGTILSVMGAASTTSMPNPFGGEYGVVPVTVGGANGFFAISSSNIGPSDCLYFYNMAWQDIRKKDGTMATNPLISDASASAPPDAGTCTTTSGAVNKFWFVYQ